jgi:signal transduction histidine kinase/PAS domain-containing protein
VDVEYGGNGALNADDAVPGLDVLQEANHPVWLWDLHRQRISWGNGAALTFWQEETLLDLIEHEFDPADPMAALFSDIQQSGPNETGLYPVTLDLLDGRRPVTLRCRLLMLDDGQPGILAELAEEASAETGRFTRFGQMVEQAPLALSLFDLDGQLLYQNPKAERLLGRSTAHSSLATLLGDSDLAETLLGKSARSGTASRLVEVKASETKGAAPFLCRLTLRKVEDPETGASAVVALWRDAAMRNAALETAAGEKAELQALLDAVSDFQWRMAYRDGAMRFTAMSEGFEALTGVKAETLEGLSFEELALRENVELSPALRQALSGGSPWRDIELAWTKGDCTENKDALYLSFSAVPLRTREGRQTGWAGIGKRAAPPQKKSPPALSEDIALFETLKFGVLLLDAKGTVTGANAYARQIFNIPLHGMPVCESFSAQDKTAIEGELAALHAETKLAPEKDDTGLSVLLPAARTRTGTDQPLRLFLFDRAAEGAPRPLAVFFKTSSEELSRAETMRSSLAQAQTALKRKSDVTANIAHELRTPLNAILGFSEIMRDERFGPVDNEKYKGYIANIHKSGQYLLSLINDFLDLSKVEAGGFTPNFEQVELLPLLEDCLELIRPAANEQNVIVRSDAQEDLPPVVADRRSLRQVILNLLSNAVKFTPEGGQVSLSAETDEAGNLLITVKDTGVGMDEADLRRAMEPYGQGRLGASRSGGTGLGLPLSRALCEANHASFAISSIPGEGTEIIITFPSTQVLLG